MIHLTVGKVKILLAYPFIITFIITFIMCTPVLSESDRDEKIAVLPFKIHSIEPMDHLITGLQEMMITRMAGKGLNVIGVNEVNNHPLAFLPQFKDSDLLAIGRELSADWILSGSLTQVGEKISLDMKLIHSDGLRTPFTLFMVEDSIDQLTDATERAATSLYNQIVGVEQIESIEIEGNRRIDSDAIKAVIESQKGEGIDQDKLDKDLRAIYNMGFFTDVNIMIEDGPTGKIVIFKVAEKPSISDISFEGNKKIKDDELREEIGIKRYTILNRNEVKQSVNRIRALYEREGYFNVKIEEDIKESADNQVALRYRIEEGEKVYVTQIEFIGNKEFDDDDLQDLMQTKEKGFFSFITSSGKLDRAKLEYDMQRIITYYYNHGYIQAKTTDPVITFEEDQGIKISIEIIEGPQYNVDEVKFEGDLLFPTEELLGKIHINKEKYFNREVIRNDILVLTDLYASEGYAYADVNPYIDQDDENHLVDITYRISKRKRVRIERINIKGNNATRDYVIRREIPVIEGDYYDGAGIKKATRNLYRLGFFENVNVETKPGSRDDLMRLDIDVKERSTGAIAFGVGYSSFDGTMGQIRVTEKNLFGRGQTLSSQVSLGQRSTQFDISFVEPWLFGKPISGGFDFYNWETEYNEYTRDSFGGGVTIGVPIKKIDEFTRGSVGYRYDDANIKDIAEGSSSIIRDMAGRNVTSSMTFALKRDSKDKPWDTSQGSLNIVSFEYAGGVLGGDVGFNRYIGESAWYFPMWKDTVIMLHGKAGYIQQRSGGKLPVYEKFRLGGINSVRGYDFASISPKDPDTGDKIGGNKMWFTNIEYRFPLVKDIGFVGLVFLDAGNVFKEEDNFKFEARKSYGAGVRWYSPLGPMRIEYGRKIKPWEGESNGEFEFTMGGTF